MHSKVPSGVKQAAQASASPRSMAKLYRASSWRMASVSSAVGVMSSPLRSGPVRVTLEPAEGVEGAPVPEHGPEAHDLQVGVEGLFVVALPAGRDGGALGGEGVDRGRQLVGRHRQAHEADALGLLAVDGA